MKTALLCLAIFLPLSVAAQEQATLPIHGNDPVRQKMFEQRKAGEMASHQERIKILQQADACVRNAQTPQAYRACEDAERASRKTFKEQDRAKKEQFEAQMNQRREHRNQNRGA